MISGEQISIYESKTGVDKEGKKKREREEEEEDWGRGRKFAGDGRIK